MGSKFEKSRFNELDIAPLQNSYEPSQGTVFWKLSGFFGILENYQWPYPPFNNIDYASF